MRLVVAVLAGLTGVVSCAVVLGDYPLSGAVPWAAALLIPLLIGVAMTLVDHRHAGALWLMAGPLGAGSIAWGVRIATGWGLDPVPAAAWAAMVIALLWPPAWSARRWARGRSAAGDGQLGDLGAVGAPQVGDPQEDVSAGPPG
jgi:hypothetical protein